MIITVLEQAHSNRSNKVFLKETGMKQESKKTAIITGSSRGIGKETAIILANKSVNVVVCSRTQSEITSAVEEINKQTGNSNVLGIKV